MFKATYIRINVDPTVPSELVEILYVFAWEFKH